MLAHGKTCCFVFHLIAFTLSIVSFTCNCDTCNVHFCLQVTDAQGKIFVIAFVYCAVSIMHTSCSYLHYYLQIDDEIILYGRYCNNGDGHFYGKVQLRTSNLQTVKNAANNLLRQSNFYWGEPQYCLLTVMVCIVQVWKFTESPHLWQIQQISEHNGKLYDPHQRLQPWDRDSSVIKINNGDVVLQS